MADSMGLLFTRVFDANGNIKNCGRDACIELIEECCKFEPDTYFGDRKTGIMNTDAIMELWRRRVLGG